MSSLLDPEKLRPDTTRPAERHEPRTQFEAPLTPFEACLLADDTRRHPMCFYLTLQFQGRLHGDRFENALRRTIARHPLLRSLVLQDRRTRPRWLVPPALDQGGERHPCLDRSTEYGPPYLDLGREPGIRVHHTTSSTGTNVRFQFHHACCDAIAALRFVEEVLRNYQYPDTARRSPSVSESQAAWRTLRQQRRQRNLRSRMPTLARLARVGRFFGQRPLSLPATRTAGPVDLQEPARVTRTLSQFEAIWQAYRNLVPAGVTVNDLILACAFAGIADWWKQLAQPPLSQGQRSPHGQAALGIAVPINLRANSESDGPCMNETSMIFLRRRFDAIRDPLELLPGVSREMNRIKRYGLGDSLPRVLALLDLHPSLLRRVIRGQAQPCTTVVSNLGRVFADSSLSGDDGRLVVDGATLQSIEFLVPIRRNVPVTFGVLSYAGDLACTLHYDPRVLDRTSVERLADLCFDPLVPSVRALIGTARQEAAWSGMEDRRRWSPRGEGRITPSGPVGVA